MNDCLRDACEAVDAALFTGDALFDSDTRLSLKDYVERWQKAINEHESINFENVG